MSDSYGKWSHEQLRKLVLLKYSPDGVNDGEQVRLRRVDVGGVIDSEQGGVGDGARVQDSVVQHRGEHARPLAGVGWTPPGDGVPGELVVFPKRL